ncbi:sensor histidine kinase [Polymorphospora rubra]|uniref:sensor histidine kinase n=1 Tax=Polymorphospora rubra TaxID=338584 RepID=UPI0033C72ECC
MLLGRLRIRGKLALLLFVPLLSLAGLAVPMVVDQVTQANRAADTARSVRLAGQVGTLVQELQRERLLSIGHVLGVVDRSRLLLQTAQVGDRVADLRADYDGNPPERIVDALDGVQYLADLRAAVLDRTASPDAVMAGYSAVGQRLIDSLRLLDGIDTATDEGRQVVALDAVLRADEGISAGASWIVVVVGTENAGAITAYIANMAALQVSIGRFGLYASAEQNELYQLVEVAANARTSPEFLDTFTADPQAAIAGLELDTLFPAVESLITLGQFVEQKIITDVLHAVTARQQSELLFAYGIGGLALLVLAAVVLLSTAVAQAVARPLTRLTQSAVRVARVAEAELVRIADEESEVVEQVRLDPVDVDGRDEIGDLARAFDRVQGTAARLVERQVASRRNVAQMFGHVGRRTQNLVGRQIALIDRLEHDETDPTRLQHLYRLDHVSSRLRRSASSLVVLSGSAGADAFVAPLPLANVVRLALGEIEDYPRVDVRVPPDITVAPGAIGDLVLALAELMENATSFSPPHTRVSVTAQSRPAGVRVTVVDHGIGMSPERMAAENARFTRRERLDLVPTELLGLFVVGRLARRHGLDVSLSPTSGGGVTADVDIAARLLMTGRPAPVRRPEPPAATRPEPPLVVAARPGMPGAKALPAAQLRPAGALPAAPALTSDGLPARTSTRRTDQVGRTPADGGLFDPAVLDRASRSLEAGRPWDAFATPAIGTDVVVAGAATPVDVTAAQPTATAPTAPAAPTDTAPARPRATTPAGQVLRQRVPGAQLPISMGDTRTAPPTPADPLTVRALVEEFESGVRRAESQAGSTVLTQRVPGASLRLPPVVVRHRVEVHRPLDPEEVRHLVTQFESGVERALREVRSDHRTEEGSPR